MKPSVLKHFALVVSLFVVLAACGGDTDSTADRDAGNGADATTVPTDAEGGDGDGGSEDDLGNALGGAGGGTLTFDGVEMPIDGATCALFGDEVDVGTISPEGHRILISTNGRNPISMQILDPDLVQWFPEDATGDEAERDGGIFASDPGPYFNNTDDRIIEASFTVECP